MPQLVCAGMVVLCGHKAQLSVVRGYVQGRADAQEELRLVLHGLPRHAHVERKPAPGAIEARTHGDARQQR